MQLGGGFGTASGILHEIDVVASHESLRFIWELKHWSALVDKNCVVGFWAKLLDYLSAHPDLAAQENIPIFVTTGSFDEHGLAAALALGIAPVAPGIRPPQMLIRNLERLDLSLRANPEFGEAVAEQADEFRSGCRHLVAMLDGSAVSDRVGRLSDHAISLSSRPFEDGSAAVALLRSLNARCAELINSWEKMRKLES